MRDKTTLLFDLDGTLVDSAPDIAVALNATLEKLGLPNYSVSDIRTWVGDGAKTLVARGLSGAREVNDDLSKDKLEQALSLFFGHYRENVCIDSKLYPDVSATLDYLHIRNYQLAVITNKPAVFIQPILSKLGIKNYFSLCLGGDSLSEKKPSALPLLHACKVLGQPIDKCVMIGDSKNDIFAAKNARMASIGFSYGYNFGKSIDIFEPDLTLHKFDDLTSVF